MSTDEIKAKVIESLLAELKADMRSYVQELLKVEFESIHQDFRRLEKTMDMWKTDLDEDRKNLRNINTNTGNIKIELKEVGNTVEKLPKKLESTMIDTVAATSAEVIPKAITNTFEVFGRRVRIIHKPKNLFSNLLFWKGW